MIKINVPRVWPQSPCSSVRVFQVSWLSRVGRSDFCLSFLHWSTATVISIPAHGFREDSISGLHGGARQTEAMDEREWQGPVPVPLRLCLKGQDLASSPSSAWAPHMHYISFKYIQIIAPILHLNLPNEIWGDINKAVKSIKMLLYKRHLPMNQQLG